MPCDECNNKTETVWEGHPHLLWPEDLKAHFPCFDPEAELPLRLCQACHDKHAGALCHECGENEASVISCVGMPFPACNICEDLLALADDMEMQADLYRRDA